MSGWHVHKRTGQNTIQYYTNLTLRTTHGSTQTLHCKHHPVLCKLYTGDNVSFHTDLTLCMPQSYTADCTVLHTLCIVDPIIMTYKQSYWLMWCFSLHLLHFSGSYKSINVTKAAVNYFLYYWFLTPQGSATHIFIVRSTWAWSAFYHPKDQTLTLARSDCPIRLEDNIHASALVK